MIVPQVIDPKACLATGEIITGVLSSAELPRLTELLAEPVKDIQFKLGFEQDQRGRCIVHCSVNAELPLCCQRCNEPMLETVAVSSCLCVVTDDEQAKSLPKAYEPLMVEQGQVVVKDLIEDELLLAIPMIPRHAVSDCQLKRNVA